MEIKLNLLRDDIVSWITSYCTTNGIESLVVGVSGGVDSALVSTLCGLTAMPTFVLSLPIHQSNEQLIRANKHIKWLHANFKNIISHNIDLSEVFNIFSSQFSHTYTSELAFANSRSRLRMIALYQVATSVNGIVVGTGNKVEDFGVGFFTKYGDGGVDISPIADLMKSEVRSLAKHLGICEELVDSKPTDGLWNDNRSDEEQIGASYDELEWAMTFQGDENLLQERQKFVLNLFKKYHQKSIHKLLPIPVYKK